MSQNHQPGDFLVFQIESGFALVRLLAVDNGGEIWHVSAYRELFPDVATAETFCANPSRLSLDISHVALTNRAFESTQTAKISHYPLTESELAPLRSWRDSGGDISDKSIRLLLGLR